ncbi:MAG: hypothetical protein KHX65_08695 [Bifidobacterium sp.]|nr:hypothetical protein [Bifidobacterium sp.]
MKRARLIDKATGWLKDCVTVDIYRYCVGYDNGNTGYKQIPYAGMAYYIGLPWVFADNDNSETIALLRGALARLEASGLIRVKPATHTIVSVRVTVRNANGGNDGR